MISGKTQICGLIGDPVEHTMSPAMHNAAFQEMRLDYVYLPFNVKSEELGRAIQGMRALNLKGLNVTIPHKVAVLPLLDSLDPLAEKIGAVNTIVNNDGILTGYNTDATGFLQPLLEKSIELKDKNIAILGAGGASRAVSFILADKGANLVILNRLEELEWAEALADRISVSFNINVEPRELTRETLGRVIEKTAILVNATSVGMSPDIKKTPVSADLLRSDLIVYDIIYNPIKTRLLIEAEAAGAEILGGIDMLVWQGVLAFEKWTGLRPPIKLMKEKAIELL
ncbi:shikimate dehydrogenase [Chloroflexota bacterium]